MTGVQTCALPISALEISATAHKNMVAAVAPYVDTSISKTVNVPEDYPYPEFENLYLSAWKAGLKGLATYRPNKILGAVLQLSSFLLDHGMTLEQAFHQPRIDVSGGGQIMVDQDLAPEIQQALAQVMPTSSVRRTVFPYAFACPAGVMRQRGMNMGCTEIMSPWGDAVAEHA